MTTNARKARPERDKTDESLRTERKNTDQMLAERRTAIEATADAIVGRAREQADTVLDAARDRADDKLEAAKAGSQAREAIARERAGEDETLKDERAIADESLRRERQAQARSLAALLPLEREKTDRYLLTERVRSDDAVAQRDDFMGIVSHDLRNLLGAISANATVLSKQASTSEDRAKTIAAAERIQRYVARMNRLIGDLVDVVSIDAGKLAVQPQRFDAAELITEAVEAFAHAAQEKGISLGSAITQPSLPAVFDRDRILQVLANLISNAIKFTTSGGTVTVRGERAGDELRISVIDTGQGISGDMLDAVFERFWQIGKNDQRGLGLGLYISKCIVDAHGGRIWVESKLDAGSAFHFTLPGAVGESA
jgi:signal transduction histidine kinase